MVQRAVAIANVSEFNKEWGFVMLDGGTNRGLSVGTRLGLRRGPAGLVALVEVRRWKLTLQSPTSFVEVPVAQEMRCRLRATQQSPGRLSRG